MENKSDMKSDANEKILAELKKMNSMMKRDSTFGRRFLMGVVGGFGTVIGATVLVSLALLLLQQFATIDVIEPVVNRVIEVVDKKDK